MNVRHKSFLPLVKGTGPNGSTRLVVATLGVPDRDGDLTMPGWFGQQTAAILPAHDWSHVPLGKGLVYEVGAEAVVDIDWNLDVPEARSWFAAVKFDLEHPPALQQWSYGFSTRPGGARPGEFKGRPVQILGPLADGSPGAVVHEVSPVMVGAGVGTRSLSADTEAAGDLAVAERIAREYDTDANERAANELARYVASGLGMVS